MWAVVFVAIATATEVHRSHWQHVNTQGWLYPVNFMDAQTSCSFHISSFWGIDRLYFASGPHSQMVALIWQVKTRLAAIDSPENFLKTV